MTQIKLCLCTKERYSVDMMAVNCDTVVNLIFCAFPIHNRLCTLNVHGEIYLKNGKVEALEAAHSVNCCNCCYPLSMRI